MKSPVVFVTFFALLVFMAVYLSPLGDRRPIPGVGHSAPEFTLAGLGREKISLAGLKGRIVILHFWATWCPPCVPELPLMNRFAQRCGDDVHLIAASVDTCGAGKIEAFLKSHGLASLPVWLDPGGDVARRYGTVKFPETFIIDRDGRISEKYIGPVDWSGEAFGKRIEKLIKGGADRAG